MAEYIERERLLHRFNIDDMMNINGSLISLNDARNVISNFPAADVAPQWISVKDRLPMNYIEVLVFDAVKKIPCVGAMNSYGEWEVHGCRTSNLNITHWMPLPEAPNEDINNETLG